MQSTKISPFPVIFGFLAVLAMVHGESWRDDPIIKEWLEEMQHEGDVETMLAPMVDIANGTIKGETALSVGGKTIYQYLGVPYAQPPVGDLRFMVKLTIFWRQF